MGESHSKEIGDTVGDRKENTEGNVSNTKQHSSSKRKAPDPPSGADHRNNVECGDARKEEKVADVAPVVEGQMKTGEGSGAGTNVEQGTRDEAAKDEKSKRPNDERSVVRNKSVLTQEIAGVDEVSPQNSETTTDQPSVGDQKRKANPEKQKKRSSKVGSLRKRNSKSKTSKASDTQDSVVDGEGRLQEEASSKNSQSHVTAPENTQDGKEAQKRVDKKSSRKSKSPGIFRRKSKMKNAENLSASLDDTSEGHHVVADNKNMEHVPDTKSSGRGNGNKDHLDGGQATRTSLGNAQRDRSKSLELRDKKLFIYVRNGNEPVVDNKRTASMKNLKTVRDVTGPGTGRKPTAKDGRIDGVDVGEVGDQSTKVKKQAESSVALQKAPKSFVEDEPNKATRPLISAAQPVADVGSAASNTKPKAAPSRPSIVITPAHETEAVTGLEKQQVRQTAVVTVTREVITNTISPPELVTMRETKPEKQDRCPAVTVGPKTSDSREAGAAASTQKEIFRIVEVKSPVSSEHKLLQVTMQTTCQKANQLQRLMTSMESKQANLRAYHRLQLLAIASKEKEINVAAGRISQALRQRLDEKLGVNLQRVAGTLAECKLQLATFQTIIDAGNRLLESGSVDDVVRKEDELASQLKVLDKHLRALQEEATSEEVDGGKVAFIPGTTDNLELSAMFGELVLDEEAELGDGSESSSVGRRLARGPAADLRWSDNPWIPYFRRSADVRLTGNELMNARIREELCFRELTRITNAISPRRFTGFVSELFDCGVDSEMKMKKLCDSIVRLASGHHHLTQTLALFCRSVSSLSVPNDSHQESRQSARSTVLNFLDRFAMCRYRLGAGTFLATGATPAVSRSASFVGTMPKVGSRRSSLSGGHNPLRTGARTPQTMRLRAELNHSTPGADVPGGDARSDVAASFEENERRYGNLSLLKFVCEMFKLKLATENTVHEWLSRLSRVDDEEAVEAMCFVLFQIGRYLDHERSRHLVNKVFVQLTYTEARHTTSGRLRAMIKDVVELRDNDWLPTRPFNYWQFLIG